MAVALCGSAVWLWLPGARERTLVAAVLEMAAIYRSLALSIPALRTVACAGLVADLASQHTSSYGELELDGLIGGYITDSGTRSRAAQRVLAAVHCPASS